MRKKVNFFQSVNFKIAISFILLLVIAIQIIGGYFIRELETTTISEYKNNVDRQVTQLVNVLSSPLGSEDQERTEIDSDLKRLLSSYSNSEFLEVRVIDDKGIVRATSDLNLQGIVGKKNEYADLNNLTSNKYAAVESGRRVYINIQPIHSPTGDAVIGAVFVKSNIESKYEEVTNIARIFFTASLIAGVISIIVTLLISRSITQPIGEMKEQALRIARGDYSGKVKVYGKDELGQLAETFNQLSERVEEAQETMESERNRLDSVLTHMTDGVVAADRRGKVITINEMATTLLNVKAEEAIGMSLLELLDIDEDYTLRKLLEEPDELLIDRSQSDEEADQMILKVDFAMIRRESGFITGWSA